jgi:ribonucleoside-triphosphate reductase
MAEIKSAEDALNTMEFANPNKSCNARCEVYSRVVGYFRPVAWWNKGKKAEWKDRKFYKPTSLGAKV